MTYSRGWFITVSNRSIHSPRKHFRDWLKSIATTTYICESGLTDQEAPRDSSIVTLSKQCDIVTKSYSVQKLQYLGLSLPSFVFVYCANQKCAFSFVFDISMTSMK